jgi:hypothetical protein
MSVAKSALWQIHLSGNNRTSLGLQFLNKFGASMKALNMKFHRHLSNGIRADKSGQTVMIESNRRSSRLKCST